MRIVQTSLRDLVPKVLVSCLVRQTVREYMERSGQFLGDVLKVEGPHELERLARKNDQARERIEEALRKKEELARVQRVVMDTSDIDEM